MFGVGQRYKMFGRKNTFKTKNQSIVTNLMKISKQFSRIFAQHLISTQECVINPVMYE